MTSRWLLRLGVILCGVSSAICEKGLELDQLDKLQGKTFGLIDCYPIFEAFGKVIILLFCINYMSKIKVFSCVTLKQFNFISLCHNQIDVRLYPIVKNSNIFMLSQNQFLIHPLF